MKVTQWQESLGKSANMALEYMTEVLNYKFDPVSIDRYIESPSDLLMYNWSFDILKKEYYANPERADYFLAITLVNSLQEKLQKGGYGPGSTVPIRALELWWDDPVMEKVHRFGCYGWIDFYNNETVPSKKLT